MTEPIALAAQPRTIVGKKVKQLRREGVVPAVVYGKSEPVNVQVNAHELRRVLKSTGRTEPIALEVGDKSYMVLAKEIQQHLTRGDFLHIDFIEQ